MMNDDEQKIRTIVVKLERIEKDIPEQLREIWEKIKLLASLVLDYFSNDYRENITTKMITRIVAALLYLLMPMDVIFDGIPLVGFSDDLIVITKVLDSMLDELKAYTMWRD